MVDELSRKELENLRPHLSSWGQRHNPSIQYVGDFACPVNDCEFIHFKVGKAWYESIIGFDMNMPFGNEDTSIGIVIHECPMHHVKFWHHLRIEQLSYNIQYIPGWPQVAKEAVKRFWDLQ